MLNQVKIVAFYSCFEEQKGQFGILVPVGKAYISLECRLIKLKLNAGYCRQALTSIVTTLHISWFDFAKIGKSINRRIKSIKTD